MPTKRYNLNLPILSRKQARIANRALRRAINRPAFPVRSVRRVVLAGVGTNRLEEFYVVQGAIDPDVPADSPIRDRDVLADHVNSSCLPKLAWWCSLAMVHASGAYVLWIRRCPIAR